MPKPISAAEAAPGLRVVLVTMDSHLASAAERAHRTLARQLPGVSLSVHAASEWSDDGVALQRCTDDIARGDIVLVLDAAYAEYVRRNDYEAGIELVSANRNVVMTRTFAKVYGLAALRIGWIYGPAEIIDAMNRVRGPFNINTPALFAGAAAMRDQAHVAKAVEHNQVWLARVSEALTALGLEVTPSVTNFILIHFPDQDGKRAADADRFLTERGFVLRAVSSYGFPNALRMTIGSDEANTGVIAALTEFMERT